MKEFKGTKGEWIIDADFKDMVLTDSGAYKPNAVMRYLTTDEELFSNAQAISAVPEMIEALKYVLRNTDNPKFIKVIQETLTKALGE